LAFAMAGSSNMRLWAVARRLPRGMNFTPRTPWGSRPLLHRRPDGRSIHSVLVLKWGLPERGRRFALGSKTGPGSDPNSVWTPWWCPELEVSTSVRVFGSRSDLIGASILQSADPHRDVVDRFCPKPTSGGLSRYGQQAKGAGSVERVDHADCAGNVVGVDPHKRTVSASVADPRGGIVATEHFRVSGDGHRALEVWAGQFGPIARWGVEGGSSWGRHTAIFLIARGYDVRDVCANRTPRSDRARQRGKSDQLDSERIARETLA